MQFLGKNLKKELLLPQHDPDDLLVRLSHADPSQPADIGNGVLHPFGDNALSAVKLLAVFVHVKSKNAGVYSGCDFGRTGRFGSVTDNSRHNGQGIDNGVGNFFESPAMEPGDSGTGTHPGTDGTAVCG